MQHVPEDVQPLESESYAAATAAAVAVEPRVPEDDGRHSAAEGLFGTRDSSTTTVFEKGPAAAGDGAADHAITTTAGSECRSELEKEIEGVNISVVNAPLSRSTINKLLREIPAQPDIESPDRKRKRSEIAEEKKIEIEREKTLKIYVLMTRAYGELVELLNRQIERQREIAVAQPNTESVDREKKREKESPIAEDKEYESELEKQLKIYKNITRIFEKLVDQQALQIECQREKKGPSIHIFMKKKETPE